MAIEIIRQFFQKSDASGSKSTILKPITWFISFLVAGFLTALHFDAPMFVNIFFIVLISLTSLAFLFAYIYCLFTNPDLLRSETYSIQKMAIEKGVYGDNSSGVFLIESEINKNIDSIKNSDDKKRIKK